MKNYYTLLHLNENSTQEEIDACYRSFVARTKTYAPGIEINEHVCTAHFPEVMEAFSILRDPGRREEYDQFQKLSLTKTEDLVLEESFLPADRNTFRYYLYYIMFGSAVFLALYALSRFFTL